MEGLIDRISPGARYEWRLSHHAYSIGFNEEFAGFPIYIALQINILHRNSEEQLTRSRSHDFNHSIPFLESAGLCFLLPESRKGPIIRGAS